MIRSSSFLGMMCGKYDYLFFVVMEKYWLASAGEGSILNVVESVFARDIGNRGAVVTSFTEDVEQNHKQVLSKNWPSNVRELLEFPSNPSLLIISTDFENFDPSSDPYIIIYFSQYKSNQKGLLTCLKEIAKAVTEEKDLFKWWSKKAAKKGTLFDRICEATELKPGIWGFSFDVKKFFQLK